MNKKTIKIIRVILGLFLLFLVGCSSNFISNPKFGTIFNIVCIILIMIVFPKSFAKDKSIDEKQPIETKIKIIFAIGIPIGFIGIFLLIYCLN